MYDAYADRFVTEGVNSARVSLRAVRGSPRLIKFHLGLWNRYLQRCVGHLVRRELQPVFRSRQSAGFQQAIVERRCREWRELAKDGQSRRPTLDLLERPISDTRRVIVQTKDERRDCVDVASGQPIKHSGVLDGLVEALVHISKVDRID